MIDPEKYRLRSYGDYRRRAQDPTLTPNEKCGFAEVFRAGMSQPIFDDIASKLTHLERPGARICDIGAGCSELALLIVEVTARRQQSLTVIDCPEMLELLPAMAHLGKIDGPFPDCLQRAGGAIGPFDAILAYSIAGTLFQEGNLFAFVDAAAGLLAEGGQFLLGDIPNAGMRKRFMASAAGKAYHAAYYGHLPLPQVAFGELEPGEIDDGVMLGLLARLRGAGLNAFVVPQQPGLPMATRREDLLVLKY